MRSVHTFPREGLYRDREQLEEQASRLEDEMGKDSRIGKGSFTGTVPVQSARVQGASLSSSCPKLPVEGEQCHL